MNEQEHGELLQYFEIMIKKHTEPLRMEIEQLRTEIDLLQKDEKKLEKKIRKGEVNTPETNASSK